jgi:hypothetical protein
VVKDLDVHVSPILAVMQDASLECALVPLELESPCIAWRERLDNLFRRQVWVNVYRVITSK